MKAYLITQGEHDDYIVVAVALTRPAALRFMKENPIAVAYHPRYNEIEKIEVVS